MKNNAFSDRLAAEIQDEAIAAHRKYGCMTSTHEGFGVLAEEVAELLEAIRENDLDKIAEEARQVSAVAMRIYWACENESPEFIFRSGLDKRD